MFQHPFIVESMMRERQRALLVEAETDRLARRAVGEPAPSRRSLHHPLARLGEALVRLGSRLQERYAPVIPAPEP